MSNKAVITGDIINFTGMPPARRQSLTAQAKKLFDSWLKVGSHAEIFRGDSFQLLLDDPEQAVPRSIQLICWFMSYPVGKDDVQLGSRISVGIGEVAYEGKNVLSSDGVAFHLSGRHFDTMKTGEFLIVHTGDEKKDKAIETILIFINKYIASWTRAQAEVIFQALDGKTQQEIAAHLSLSQPSVNSRLKSAGWKELEPAVRYIGSLVKNQ